MRTLSPASSESFLGRSAGNSVLFDKKTSREEGLTVQRSLNKAAFFRKSSHGFLSEAKTLNFGSEIDSSGVAGEGLADFYVPNTFSNAKKLYVKSQIM